MKKLKAIGYHPLQGAATRGQGGHSRRHNTVALVVVALAAPALAGCPGHLDGFDWSDARPPIARPAQEAAAPAPTPTPADTKPAPPVLPPDSGVLPPPPDTTINVETCSQPAEVLAKILMPNCAGCHGGAAPRAGLDLASMGAKVRLMAAVAKGAAAPACTGKPLLAADGTGVFLDKITGTACGPQMPFMKAPLSAVAIKCLTDWLKPAPPTVDAATCFNAADISAKILTPKCGGCHAGATAPAGLDLVATGSKARLLAGVAKNAMCLGKPLAAANGTGVIFDKIQGTGCGSQMPFGKTTLSNQELWCMKEWVARGTGGTFPAVAAPLPTMAPAGPGPGPGPAPVSCATPDEISNKILKPKCLPCHGRLMSSGFLDLETPGAKARIVGIASKSGGACAGKPLADGAGTGVFFDKVVGPVPTGCGNQMPFGTPPLSPAEITCLKAWITQ
jgi:hypothetical protein